MIKRFSGKYRFLSNFYWHNGWCVELPFQAAKAKTEEERQKILNCMDAREAKKLGRATKLREDWEEVKVQVMLTLLRNKFKIPELRQKLIETTNQKLVEGNTWHDNVWGDCYCDKCAHKHGRNLLGKLLMHVRQEIILNFAFGRTEETWEELPYEESKSK
jgi:hypothetical protein